MYISLLITSASWKSRPIGIYDTKGNINSLNQLASNCVRANATEDSTGFHIKKERDDSLTPLGDSSNWSLIYQMSLRYSWRWNNDVKINYSIITYSKTPLTCCFLYFRCAAVPVTDWYWYIVTHAQWSALRHNMQMEVVKWLSSLSLVRLILLAFKSIFRTTLSELWRSYH